MSVPRARWAECNVSPLRSPVTRRKQQDPSTVHPTALRERQLFTRTKRRRTLGRRRGSTRPRQDSLPHQADGPREGRSSHGLSVRVTSPVTLLHEQRHHSAASTRRSRRSPRVSIMTGSQTGGGSKRMSSVPRCGNERAAHRNAWAVCATAKAREMERFIQGGVLRNGL